MTFIRTSTCADASKRVALTLAGLLGALPGWSQVVDHLPKPTATARQSALNPAPMAMGNPQHRGRMSADLLTGVTDGNVLASQLPYARIAGPSGSVKADFWPFPQPTDGATFTHDGTYFNVTSTFGQALNPWAQPDDQGPNVVYPLAGATAITGAGVTGVVGFTAGWTAQTGPSTAATGGTYHVVAARAAASQTFAWYPRVQGLSGDYRNFGIRVFLPTPDATGAEARIGDARYRVTYHMPIGPGRFMLKQKTITLSQKAGGSFWLNDGQENYFPMMTETTYTGAVTRTGGAPALVNEAGGGVPLGSAAARARVELVNQSDSPQPNEVVVADQVTFRQDPMGIQSAPTVVGPHGGRKIDTAALPVGVPIQQPAAGNSYVANPYVVPDAPLGRIAHPNDSFDFANNPRDPAFVPATGDRANPSVLYQGPTSLIDPRDAGGVSVPPTGAVNHQAYRNGLGQQIPFFSHAQVIVVRRERIHNPESGTANSSKDGSRTVVGTAIYGVDWATRTVIWRFPDRTHLPENTQFNGSPVPNAGLRNPTIGKSEHDSPLEDANRISQIPDVVAYDGGSAGTPDGAIQDDEVYLTGDSFASATVVPGISVFGTAQVPAYNVADSQMNGVTEAAPDRYSKPGAVTREAIQMPVAFVALGNGTLLALDPFGNNDNRYFENAADTTKLGKLRAGTTNVLWVFAPNSHPRVRTGTFAETVAKYNQRLKTEVPVPGSYFTSAPTVAWARADDDAALNTAVQEPRLFVGNQNGALYALDARALAAGVDGTGKPLPIPFRKGEQIQNPTDAYKAVTYGGAGFFATEAAAHRQELKWWFRASLRGGGIASTPAVSAWPHPHGVGATSKGVYVTTLEGRVFCLDWDGPVRRSDHEAPMVWDGSAGDPLAAVPLPNAAAAFNDDYFTHHYLPTSETLAPDDFEGTVRPRWAFPNTYQNTQATEVARSADADFSAAFPGTRLLKEQSLYLGITSSPTLMDFPYIDPDDSRLSGIRRYVVVAANDAVTGLGKLLLLDQIGDRRDFLSNPTPDKAVNVTTPFVSAVPAVGAHVYGQPLDQFVSPVDNGAFTRSTPAWTYRTVYDHYDGTNAPDVTQRNAPSTAASVGGAAKPARRTVPTIYVGGVGRLYAIDLDESTGLFLRWRDSGATQPQALSASVTVPGPYWTGNAADAGLRDLLNPADSVNPVNPMLRVGGKNNYAFNRIMARTVAVQDGTDVESLIVTGGPMQNRNNDTAKLAADALPPLLPTPTVGPAVDATHPSVPLLPGDDPVILKPVLDNITSFAYNMGGAPPVLPTVDLTGRYGNQDIDDPLTTTRGAYPTAAPATNQPNVAYQYPSLWITTAGDLEKQNALYQVNSNIEGEDTTALTGGTMGWALVDGDLTAFNTDHVFLSSAGGAGGPYSGATTFTNAYYESFDSSFTARRSQLGAKAAPDTTVDYPYYPDFEPSADVSIFADGPRPHFKPRPLFEGDPAAAPTPLLADEHTGQSGFPLDLNGLFYDKSYATSLTGTTTPPPAAPALPTYNNEQGKFRLPAYSGIGSRFTPLVPEGALVGHVPGTPVSDDERRNHFAGAGIDRSDDYSNVNPAGHRVTWIYAGGSEGVLHEITPVFKDTLGGTGNNFGGPLPVVGLTSEIPNVKIDVFDEADFNTLQAAAAAGTPIRPNRDGFVVADGGLTQPILSRAAKLKKNVFEWGQKAYIVVWDVPVTARSYTNAPVTGIGLPAIPVPADFRININANGVPIANNWPLATSGGAVTTYPYNPGYSVPSRPLEAGYYRARLGMAFFAWDVQRQEPGKALHLTVGPVTSVVQGIPADVSIITSTGSGLNALAQRNSLEPDVYAANPLGVAAHLVATRDGNIPVAAEKKQVADAPTNSIGPFRTENGSGVASGRTADQGAADGSRDPDRDGFDYSQALANGNTIVRRDLRRYTALGILNPGYNALLKDANGANDPSFYVPVAAGTGYLGHGRTGSTDMSAVQRNLRLANRSMLPTLGSVRAEVLHDVSWRWWPGNIPNADGGTDNPRKTPAGMGDDGRINPLPWESRPTADSALSPWKANNQATDVAAASSPDYPDIEATNRSQTALSLIYGGQDILRGSGELPNGQFTVTPNPAGLVSPIAAANLVAPYAATLSVTVPRFQPANLVAMHSLTSAYVPAAPEELASAGSTGPLQLPRSTGGLYPRALLDGATNNPTIAPYGYTTMVRIFVDSSGDGKWTAGEAYRDVEVWSGVAVDLGLESGQSDNAPALVDLGRLPAGFGMQNGLLGYGQGSPYQQSGFLPTPLSTAYGNFFKPFTVKNVGNVNLWNLRASQKVQAPFAPPATYGTNNNFYYFGMKSRNVEGRFGVMAVGADPLGSMVQPNVMPQIVTSLDQSFDGAWDSLLQANLPAPIYNRDYAPFQGRHMLKKAVPGSANGTALGLPDVPRDPLISVPSSVPQVSVSVPVGTPAGVYESSASNVNGAPPMLSVFEDHDTNADPDGANPGYRAVPLMVGNNVLPAGPTYGGINTLPPGFIPQSLAGGAISQGNLRVKNTLRDAGGNLQRIVYQPHTSPAVDLRLTVSEAPLTGLVPDWAVASPVAGRTGLFSGLVPGFDPYPLSETSNFLTPGGRASSSLQPTAYRGPDGALHVYFARSLAPGANPDARGLQLYHSHLTWNAALGTWQSSNPGAPVNDPTAAAGQWFSSPALLTTGAGQETNSAPFVLNASPASTRSTLFWMNSKPTGGGNSVDTLAYSALAANGNPVGALPFVVNPDPSLRRFGVRAFNEPATQTTVALYYGGPAGRWGLYYVPRAADGEGVPVGAAPDAASERNVERRLALPSGLVSAYEPSAVVRRLSSVNNGNTPVVDLYYTGVLRTSSTPDLYMTRYSLNGAGRNARMNPLTLPVIRNETLKRLGRDVAYRAQHIQWNRDLGQPAFLPVIAVNNVPLTVAANWQWDAASQMLFQNVARPTGVLQVLVDTSVGIVRFRGVGMPTGNQAVSATYQPQTYRLTPDEAPDSGSIAVFDNRTLPASNPANEFDTILRRPAGNVPAGRSWLIWQKDKTGQNATSLFYSVRRVGIDLKTVGALGQNESLELAARDGNGNSPVAGVSVTIGGTPVPFDVDVKRGKIFVDSFYEGLPAQLTFVAHNEGPPVTSTPRSLTYTLLPVEESVSTDPNLVGTSALNLAQAQNEGQAFAFLDLFQPSGVTRTIPDPTTDPTLQAGRMWMFWSSPRARTGLFPFGPNDLQALPRGYDLFYQTLAPNFESLAL